MVKRGKKAALLRPKLVICLTRKLFDPLLGWRLGVLFSFVVRLNHLADRKLFAPMLGVLFSFIVRLNYISHISLCFITGQCCISASCLLFL
jgi:hypothetical protein